MYALVVETHNHQLYRDWLDATFATAEVVGLSDLVLSGFIRVVTNPRVLMAPITAREALDVVDALRGHPNVAILRPGARHWQIFRGLCIAANAKGNLVADAFHAALAIESGAEFITTDRDFSRFPGLRWRHPLAS